MALITQPIPQQRFETIRARIGEILRDEIDNQVVLNYEPYLECAIWNERDINYNDSELDEAAAINIMLESGDFGNAVQTLVSQEVEYRYIIEAVMQAKGGNGILGDTIAMTRLQRLMGVCRAILMSPRYITLGFKAPYIEHRRIDNFFFGKPVRQDSSHTVAGRMVLCVKTVETVDYTEPILLDKMDTMVTLYETELGYKFVNYGTT